MCRGRRAVCDLRWCCALVLQASRARSASGVFFLAEFGQAFFHQPSIAAQEHLLHSILVRRHPLHLLINSLHFLAGVSLLRCAVVGSLNHIAKEHEHNPAPLPLREGRRRRSQEPAALTALSLIRQDSSIQAGGIGSARVQRGFCTTTAEWRCDEPPRNCAALTFPPTLNTACVCQLCETCVLQGDAGTARKGEGCCRGQGRP